MLKRSSLFSILLFAVAGNSHALSPVDELCIDSPPVGDGWGWDGSESCRLPVTTTICVDSTPVGDGWGWDGTDSCKIEEEEEVVCVDSAPVGDGWGWDGTQSCRVERTETTCIDSPPIGDGWGWDGANSCRIDETPSPVVVKRLPSGGHLSNPQFQWAAVDGASSYRLIILDHRGDRISQQLTAQQANCTAADACRFTPTVQIHDSILKWRVQSFDAAGEWLSTSNDVSYNTLRSLAVQPYTDRDNIGAPPNPGNGFPTIEVDQLLVLNNDWNARTMNRTDWKQTVAVDRQADGKAKIVFEYDWLRKQDGDEYAVKSYPQLVYGNKLGSHVSGSKQELGLPETVANLGEFKIDYQYNETGSAERNVAFESFFHTDCTIGGPNFDVDDREYEMMVWVANPDIRTPGSTKAVSGVLIDNQLWDVWIKPQQNKHYIAFTAVNEVTRGTLNWKRFVDWTVNWTTSNQTRYGLTPLNTGWCMAAIEFGVETWWGAARLEVTEMKITRQ